MGLIPPMLWPGLPPPSEGKGGETVIERRLQEETITCNNRSGGIGRVDMERVFHCKEGYVYIRTVCLQHYNPFLPSVPTNSRVSRMLRAEC